jgi:putative endonuclease
MPGWRNLPAGRQVGINYMYYTYVIKSKVRKYIYVGLTSDIERRLKEHNDGKNRTTKPYLPFDLLLKEYYSTRIEARKREIYLKSGIGKEFIKSNFK